MTMWVPWNQWSTLDPRVSASATCSGLAGGGQDAVWDSESRSGDEDVAVDYMRQLEPDAVSCVASGWTRAAQSVGFSGTSATGREASAVASGTTRTGVIMHTLSGTAGAGSGAV